MLKRMQRVSCWHLDLFIFWMLSIQQEQLNGTEGLGEYEALHTLVAESQGPLDPRFLFI